MSVDIFKFSLPLVVLLPFIGAIIAAFISQFNRLLVAYVSGFITLLSLIILTPSAILVFSNKTLIQSYKWIENIGLYFAFRLDGLSLLFALLILIIGFLIVIYASYYLSKRDSMGKFYAYLMMFMGSMLGVVLSENILLLVIFWELTSLTSFLLIGYWHHRKDAREGAKISLIITGAGGLSLLGGVLLLGYITGSYQLSEILTQASLVQDHPYYEAALVLILLGVFTKSAQFPFHFWLPHAMAAPTPVSAYLHSATMVKAGIFLLARLFPVLSGTDLWFFLVSSAGIITLLIGAYTALFKDDLKGLLAYSTISHLGLITLLFGLGTKLAVVAAIFHIINHATFKASLFMVAGIIDHEAGTRDMRKLNGLFKYMPHTATLAIVASLAMAGVPLLNGFLSKEMFFTQVVSVSSSLNLSFLIPILAVVAGVFSVAYSLRFIHDVFFNGEPIGLTKTPHEPPRFMKIPVDILVFVCLIVGILPAYTVAPILDIAVKGSLQATPPEYSLAIWHGINLPLIMSMIALGLGIVAYFNYRKLLKIYEIHKNIDAKRIFLSFLEKFIYISTKITRNFDKNSLQNALAWTIFGSMIMTIFGFIAFNSPIIGPRDFISLDFVTVILFLAMILATFYTVIWHNQRFISLIALGVVGLGVSIIFVKFSAPDLALTQISVEIVTIILLLLALYFLPQKTPKESNKRRIYKDIILSVTSGIGITLFTMMILSREFDTISTYYINNSLPGGGGKNVVNVILVDFRGFDTLGEIIVLALAGLGVYAMLQNITASTLLNGIDKRFLSKDVYPLILRTFSRLLMPFMIIVAMFIFLRGHNLPGGGFIAGLITAVALLSIYLANGIKWTQQRLKVDMHLIIGLGLLIATLTGLVAIGFGYPFLTSAFTHIHWPIIGEFEIASAIVFDLGVFLVVVGFTVLSLTELGKLGINLYKKNKSQKLGDNE